MSKTESLIFIKTLFSLIPLMLLVILITSACSNDNRLQIDTNNANIYSNLPDVKPLAAIDLLPMDFINPTDPNAVTAFNRENFQNFLLNLNRIKERDLSWRAIVDGVNATRHRFRELNDEEQNN